VYLLWWVQERHVSAAIVAAILAAGDLALMLAEVPTGWFADRFGHRTSLLVGSFVQVVAMLLCWLGQGVAGLTAASVLVALGDGFRSGADQALLYRTCVALGAETTFQRIEARTRATLLVALVVLVVAGGLIVQRWGFAAAWIAEAGLSAIGLAIAWAMVEPGSQSAGVEGAPGDSTVSARFCRTVDGESGLAFGCRTLAALVVPAALLAAIASSSSFLAQTSVNDAATATWIVAAITVAEAAGAAVAMGSRLGNWRVQALVAIAGMIATGAALVDPRMLLPVAVCLSFFLGVVQPARAAAIQSAAAEDVRARAASMANACDMALKMIALPLAGRWRSSRRR
jgi:MFS family permease